MAKSPIGFGFALLATESATVFSITYQDVSGELSQAVTATTNGSSACLGDEDVCPRDDDLGPLEGNWKLDFAGVGPNEGDTSWFSISDTGPEGPRSCWFNDIYQFGGDGSFRNVQGDETWIEPWQGAVAEGCGAPVAPHNGSNNAVFEYDEAAGSLKLTGLGAHLGLAKVVNGAELSDPAAAPGSVTYKVVELIGDSLTVRINFGPGCWEYRLSRGRCWLYLHLPANEKPKCSASLNALPTERVRYRVSSGGSGGEVKWGA